MEEQKKVDLFPEVPEKCEEKNCKEKPLFAIWLKGQPFHFVCEIHQGYFSGQLIEQDDVETYRKKRKRKIYQKHFQEYL